METVKIINVTKKVTIARNAVIADRFFTRFKGLMCRKDFGNIDGICIKRCKSIHTFFMRFNIDVIFIDRDGLISEIIKGLEPWRISPYVKEAEFVIELPEGTIDRTETSVGDEISLAAHI